MSTPRSRIQKGKELEKYISEQIIAKGLDDGALRTDSGRGKKDKRDVITKLMILDRTAGIEAKNHKTPHIKDWWEQTCKLEKQGYEPILAYKLGGESYGDTKAVIYLNTLLDLLKAQNGYSQEQENTGIPNTDKWIVKSAIEVLKKVLKILEKYNK